MHMFDFTQWGKKRRKKMKKEIWKERKISKTVSFSENKYELVPWYLAL